MLLQVQGKILWLRVRLADTFCTKFTVEGAGEACHALISVEVVVGRVISKFPLCVLLSAKEAGHGLPGKKTVHIHGGLSAAWSACPCDRNVTACV